MGAGECCGKCVIIFINIIFLILGIVFLAIGVIMVGYQSMLDKYVDLDTTFESIMKQITNENDPKDAAEQLVKDFFQIFQGLGIAFLVLGIFMFVVCILGMCGACCSVKCMLIAYVVVVGVVALAQIIVVGLYAGGVIDKSIKKNLQKALRENYSGNYGTNLESVAINAIQAMVKCCGIAGGSDYDDTPNWNKTEGYKIGDSVFWVDVKIPVTCCIMVGTFPSSSLELQDRTCPTLPTDLNSYQKKGCFDAVDENFQSFKTILIGIVAGFIGIEVVLLAVSICVLCLMSSKVNPV